ncbi:RagB/SusD family nutrient uptake outer membrane protein [Chitinophaga rhizosphaerae]|uniref:RagB/SusD family nutrient uptake outer membrane protein n=1 Tax=Chitinophaga rhizosphaerae TaxID=1864947 RepID=UPI000F813B98|nr:RagB/SusD family nutrient uptake outer membrane protein [Chitinophaga rhizosphaerae]
MKSIYKYCFAAVASAGLLTSCAKKDLLDPTVVRSLNEELTFSDSVRTMAFVTSIYSELGANSFNSRYGNGGSLAEGSDESVSRLFGATQAWVPLMIGTLNATRTTPYEKVYNNGWNNIRRVNTFLKNFGNLPLSGETKNQLLGEVKFLRAWYFWTMVQHFGGLPLIGDKLYTLDDTILEPRASYAECIDYLVKELDEAAELVVSPTEQRSEDYGRVNKGFCMGLKARILLNAASKLYNGGQESIASAAQKPLVGYMDNKPERWTTAREAAEALINTGWYSLMENGTAGKGFYELFIERKNSEYIFPAMAGNNRTMEANFLPRSRNGNVNGCPSLNAAKRFGMNNGLPITDPASGYDPANPFKDRDPRFKYTILNNGDKWRTNASSTAVPIWTHIGAETDGVDASLVYTGMFFRKFCSESTTGNGGSQTDRVMPIIRYADILLMYAEASIEEGQFEKAAEKIIMIRKRGGIKPGGDGRYGLKASGDKAYWTSVIQNERAVELCLEDSRFWDVRRWKTAPVDLNTTIYRLMITKVADNQWTYAELPVDKNPIRVFQPHHYFFPLPMAEVMKNTAMIQNPGY